MTDVVFLFFSTKERKNDLKMTGKIISMIFSTRKMLNFTLKIASDWGEISVHDVSWLAKN